MRALLFFLCVAVAGFAGYLLGSRDATGHTSEQVDHRRPRPPRRLIEIPAEELARVQQRVARADALEADNERLRERLEKLAPAATEDGELPVGNRRPDGTIVGGARWSKMTTTLALGFLDGMVEQFFRDANLTETQRQRLRAEMQKRVGEVMQTAADFVNGDLTADQAYAALDTIATDSRAMLATVLDDKQIGVYRNFEKQMTGFVHNNVVTNEMATLRKELDLDPEQEKKVRAIVEERYRRVQGRLNAPLPNMFFKPMRRERDRDIYAQTGDEIRRFLRPEQVAAFDQVESKAPTALYAYRTLLIPKGP
ncbi:MAG: hypothetical protein ACYTG3_06440 [Planctomycetota bacterium]